MPKYVSTVSSGADSENIAKCFRILFLDSGDKQNEMKRNETDKSNNNDCDCRSKHFEINFCCVEFAFETYRSMPSCSRKLTRPNAAGALCNMIAKNTIISTS